ncbi:hypothetical protein B0J12DRAFT_705255 [Macrophomina phaseolina]|uniref:Uncharacterized protein n=1 Tax=Macrophomina phaseolina TaxID=35725 RepID=A0ABQ8FSY1_9PEZI|nr:hypothetical protein B0J12DRAFT_705255 [Macrophomina phaseolina]
MSDVTCSSTRAFIEFFLDHCNCLLADHLKILTKNSNWATQQLENLSFRNFACPSTSTPVHAMAVPLAHRTLFFDTVKNVPQALPQPTARSRPSWSPQIRPRTPAWYRRQHCNSASLPPILTVRSQLPVVAATINATALLPPPYFYPRMDVPQLRESPRRIFRARQILPKTMMISTLCVYILTVIRACVRALALAYCPRKEE